MITSNQFSKSFFYIAPGFDFEPLSRFSHLCDTFIYTNLYFSKEEVLKSFNYYVNNSEFIETLSIKEYDHFDETKYFELSPTFKQELQSAAQVLNSIQRREYENTFVPALRESQWMIEIELIRKGMGRKLKMYYMTAEGLASYIALSQNGKFPPYILCTVQTGILEVPNGLMSQIFMHTNSHPKIWVRGCEAQIDYFYDPSTANPALQNFDKLFSIIGSDIQFDWEAQGSYLEFHNYNRNSKRFCKSYITKEFNNSILEKKFNLGSKNIINTNGLDSLSENIKKEGKHLILIPSRLKKYLTPDHKDVEFSFWDELFKNNGKKISMQRSIDFMLTIDNMLQFDFIHFTPYGLEDEGILLQNFLKSHTKSIFNCYVHRPLDLLDIRN